MTDSWKTVKRNQNEIALEKGYLVFCFTVLLSILCISQASAFNKEDLVKSLKSNDTDIQQNALAQFDELDNSQLMTIERLNKLLIPIIENAIEHDIGQILIFTKSLQKKRREEWDKKALLQRPPTSPKLKYSGQCPDNMASIPAGIFMAGEVGDLSEMSIDTFCMDKYEVTQAEYELVIGDNPSGFKGPNLPVERVTWIQAKQYCEKVNKRLPTEWEWEKAAKAGTTTEYYWGNDIDGSYAWYDENSGGKTHPVGQKKPNRYGLYDIPGNVWEWTSSGYDGSGNQKVLRGGSWSSNPFYVRPTIRYSIHPSGRGYYYGFRCVQ